MTQIDPKIATDLDAVKRAQIEKEVREQQAKAEREEREQRALEAYAKAWEREMKRTFKGIFRHSSRKQFLGVTK